FVVISRAAIGANCIAPSAPADGNIGDRLLPPSWPGGEGAVRLLGTDQVGRDVLSRLIHGARVSLLVGLAGTGVSLLVGTALGLMSGFWSGPIDRILSRLTDIQLAFPFIPLPLPALASTPPRLPPSTT